MHKAGTRTSLDSLPFAPQLYCYAGSEEVLLSPVDEVRDLGMTISADLSWKPQIGYTVAKGRSSAAWVLSVSSSREPDVMLTLYKTYVRSQLEYGSALWHPQCIEDLGVVEAVQRPFK